MNIPKSTEFLYASNQISKHEITETILLIIALKQIKYLRINLMKEVQDPYTANYKMLFKEIKEILFKEIKELKKTTHIKELEKDNPYTWIKRLSKDKKTKTKKTK